MNVEREFIPDLKRRERVGLDEAVFCQPKSVAQIDQIVRDAIDNARPQFLTRLTKKKFRRLSKDSRQHMEYDGVSRTAFVNFTPAALSNPQVAVITAGTSDIPIAREAARTLEYHNFAYEEYFDVGVSGLWRFFEIERALRELRVIIIVAGMDAALPSVVAGMLPAAIIAVPSSVGYGVAEGGRSALESILSSCASGVTTVNIDNGFGAACAAIRILRQLD